MEIRFLNEQEYTLWDEFVNSSPQGFLFSKSWWLNILTNGDFKICVAITDNVIFAGLPLPFFSTQKIKTTSLTQSIGVLFADFSKNKMRLQKQLTKQKEFTYSILDKSEGLFRSFNMKFNYSYNYWLPFYWRGYKQTSRYTYLIDYNNFLPEEEFKRFSKGHKWILNKVQNKCDLVVTESDNLLEFYLEAKKTYTRQKKKIGYSYELLEELHKKLVEGGHSKIFKITDSNNAIHAIEYFIYNHNEAFYWLGASGEEHRDSGGHTYLTWHAINYFKDKVKIFNFGGSMIEPVERNFRNFSAEPHQYFVISKGNRDFLLPIKIIIKNILIRK